MVSGVIFYLFIIHIFGQTFFAEIGVLQAVLGLVATICTFGLTQAMQHFISSLYAKKEFDQIHNYLRKTFYLIVLLCGIAFALIYFISPFLIAIFLQANNTPQYSSAVKAVEFLTFAVVFYIASNIVNSMILGFHRFKISGMLVILNALLSYGFAVILALKYRDIQAVVAGWAAAYFLISIAGSSILMKLLHNYPSVSFNAESFSFMPVLKYALPVLLSSVVTFSSVYADRLIVAALISPDQFAVYNLALLIASSVSFFVSPLNNILLPKISQYFSYNDSSSIRIGVRLTINVVSFIYIPLAVWIAVLGLPIIKTLTSNDYSGGAIPLAIILFISAIFVSQSVLVQGIQGIRITKIFIFSSSMALFANVVLSLILIPRFFLIGAAVGYSSVSIVNFAIIFYFARQFKVASYDFRTLSKVWASSLGVLAVITIFSVFILPLQPFTSFLNNTPIILVDAFYLMIYILLGLAVYATMIRITKGISVRDIDFVYSFLPKSLLFTKKIILAIFVRRSRTQFQYELKA